MISGIYWKIVYINNLDIFGVEFLQDGSHFQRFFRDKWVRVGLGFLVFFKEQFTFLFNHLVIVDLLIFLRTSNSSSSFFLMLNSYSLHANWSSTTSSMNSYWIFFKMSLLEFFIEILLYFWLSLKITTFVIISLSISFCLLLGLIDCDFIYSNLLEEIGEEKESSKCPHWSFIKYLDFQPITYKT